MIFRPIRSCLVRPVSPAYWSFAWTTVILSSRIRIMFLVKQRNAESGTRWAREKTLAFPMFLTSTFPSARRISSCFAVEFRLYRVFFEISVTVSPRGLNLRTFKIAVRASSSSTIFLCLWKNKIYILCFIVF
ncbi:MAG: hypothetical protein A4E42_00863 [Methanoregulaceae archaeon PtaU1.Bin222]|nr:MAG: hypothetical protein A4E42_00863 [Methanoregulaceae archaeon PtaU1.Bin222]